MVRMKKALSTGISLGIACLAFIGFLSERHAFRVKVSDLGNRLENARQREEEAIVVRHVSKQMEEIAYQQKEISDRQRKEAELQAEENFRMKLRVEEEWKKAVKAQQEAVEAYRLADKQKALAEERQYQAEYAKRVADTLVYLTLGRSLGSLSITQHKTGNEELAALLAYAAWSFVKRYQGDTFLPAVFNSLSLSSGQPRTVQSHKGGIVSIVRHSGIGGSTAYYTVSKYGEILYWTADRQGTYSAKTLFFDPQFDFRGACMLSDTLCAVSYEGSLLKFAHGNYRILPLGGKGYLQVLSFCGKPLLLSAAGTLTFSGQKKTVAEVADITCVDRTDSCLLLGRKDGEVVCLSFSGAKRISMGKPHSASVTAFGYCHGSRQLAVGYADGTILLFDGGGKNYQKLVGHRSAVTRLKLRGSKLYSCSYDRTLRLWNLATAERLESVVVFEGSSWFRSLELDPQGEILFAGDESGRLYAFSVSPDTMAERIKKKLRRNFTREEWAYYVGNRTPFESYISKEHNL